MARVQSLLLVLLLFLGAVGSDLDARLTCPGAAVNAFTGCYFDNKDFTNLKMVRTEPLIQFTWGTGSPSSLLHGDTFSVRWQGQFDFPAGTYEFTGTSDDGLRVYVDGAMIIDEWSSHPPKTVTAAKSLTAGRHQVEVRYFEGGGGAVAKLSWKAVQSSSPAPQPLSCGSPGVGTFTGCYYDSEDFMNLKLVRNDPQIQFNWGGGSPSPDIGYDTFSAHWTGDFDFAAGTYEFSATSDDGIVLSVDGLPIIDEWTTHPAITYTATKAVSGGRHRLEVRYFENRGGAVAHVSWLRTGAATPTTPSAPPIPELTTWRTSMTYRGAQHCDQARIASSVGSFGVATEDNVWYYDGTRVYEQIARFTNDASWYVCASYTNAAYRAWVLATTSHLAGSNRTTSALGGWRVFPHGLVADYRRRRDVQSREAVLRLAYNSAYAWGGGAANCGLSRETAYIANAYLAASDLGEPGNPLLTNAIDNLLAHIDQWFVTKSCEVVPFMVGLALEALIYAHERTADPRIPPAVELAADRLWEMAWLEESEAFYYRSASATLNPAPDLNMLIAPAYAWLWQRTGAQRHLERGDRAFAGGVRRAHLGAGKAFSQNYRSSFDYVKWRSQAPGTVVPLSGY